MTATLVLPSKLDTAAAPALKEQLVAQVDNDLVLDGSSVSQIGARCVELLVVACADAARRGRARRFEGFPDAVIEQLGLLGFTPETLAAGEYS